MAASAQTRGGGGTGAARVEKTETLDSVLADAGVTGRGITDEDLLGAKFGDGDSGVHTPLGQGRGYTSYSKAGRQFGTAKTVAFIQELGARWAETHEDGPRLQIGDISSEGGGPLSPHKSHQRGVDFDIRLIRNDGQEGPTTITSPTYSRAETQNLVDLIRTTGGNDIQYIFSKDTALNGVRFEQNHYRHLHVRLRE